MMMLRADPWVVYSRDGIIRRAASPFQGVGNATDIGAHIANHQSVRQRVKRGFISPHEHSWSFVDLQRWLDKHYTRSTGHALPAHYVRDVMRPYIKQILRFTFLTGSWRGADSPEPESLNNAYFGGPTNMWGCDFVMDDRLQVSFLECNGAPALRSASSYGMGGMAEGMHASGLKLALKLQAEPWPRLGAPAALGGWELVYNEAMEACTEKPYDPCSTFHAQTQEQIGHSWSHASPEWPEPGAPYEVKELPEEAEAVPNNIKFKRNKGWYGPNRNKLLRDRYGNFQHNAKFTGKEESNTKQ